MFYELKDGTFAETYGYYNNEEYVIYNINSNKTETNKNINVSVEDAIDESFGIKSNCWNLNTLPQYHFPRHEFCNIWEEVFKDIDGIEWDSKIMNGIQTPNFHSYHDNDDEYYIIHLPSGTMINWYKHLGRTNTCNKNLSLSELKLFFILLKNDMNYIK